MANNIKKIEIQGQGIEPQSIRTEFQYSSEPRTSQHQFSPAQVQLTSQRLIFEPLVYLPLVLERTKKLQPKEKLQVYGNLFKMFFYFLEMEEEKRLSGLLYSQTKMKSSLLGLEFTRHHFRQDFPHAEFPV